MPKRKAEAQAAPLGDGHKRAKSDAQAKSINLLDADSSSEDESVGGVELDADFKVNEQYAKRFEYNKKREELARLEEKYQKPKPKGEYGDKYDEDSESSDEDEDDDGFLATEALDAEISATLQAIRSKDPRVYDEKITFYAPTEEDDESAVPKTEKPMYLRDYHRENLLAGYTGEEDAEAAPKTFAEEQEELKKQLISEMHAAVDDESEDEGFLQPKSKPEVKKRPAPATGIHPSRAGKIKIDLDVNNADKDPETFLSNFMAARAWVPTDGARFQPLESDDDEELDRAEQFETAYNLRFENATGSNEALKSYARDVAAAKSVRREEPNSRKKQRDAQREKKSSEKAEKEEELAQLRRLKIGEMEEKLKKIKKAAGTSGKILKDEDWMKFLNESWDDDTWETEMMKRFGEEYYAEQEMGSESEADDEETTKKKKKKVKKPKWDDDIDIKDLVPDFEDEEEEDVAKIPFTLSDDEDEDEGEGGAAVAAEYKNEEDGYEDEDEDGEGDITMSERPAPATKAQVRASALASKKASRLERAQIADLVDTQLTTTLPSSTSASTRFRYRATSPTTLGLSSRDILLADDTALNTWAGLKKLAPFRAPDLKRRDKRRLAKKARLRQWRLDTFGDEREPAFGFAGGPPPGATGVGVADAEEPGQTTQTKKKKKKRSRKPKISLD